MDDLEENAAIVNALQRRSDVVIQKSLAEGFGLTVAEAMWKERPTVASAVGGIQDQIENGVNGLLVDPNDLEQFGRTVIDVLQDPARARELGRQAHVTVRDHYLAPHYLSRFLELAMSVS
jgi:trehalose synthase